MIINRNNNEVASKYFQSYDLGCCAALISKDFELVDLDKSNQNKVLFVFNQSQELDEAVNDYWVGKLYVSARLMFETIKMLKNRIYSN